MNDGFPSNMPLAAGAILARIAGGTAFDINGGTIDGTVIGGTTPAAVSCTMLAIAGSAPGTPSAVQVLIGGGEIKAGSGILCPTLAASTSAHIGDGANSPDLSSTLHVDRAASGAAVITLQNATYQMAFGCSGAVFFGSRSAHDVYLQRGGSNTVRLSATEVDLLGGVYLYVGGTKVVGAQGSAVANASGGATVDAEARTAINTLLARLRTHGLIAT